MATQSLSVFDEALKIDYLPVIREQLSNANVLLSKVKRNERDVVGNKWQMVAHYQRNSGVGSGAETDLPAAGSQAYKNPNGVVKFTRGRIQVSGPVMEASKNDKGAIVRALDSEIRGVTRDMEREVNYQFQNDGTSVRGLVAGDPGTGTTLTVDGPGTGYLYDGQLIDIVNPSGGAARANSTDLVISTVDSSTVATMVASLDTDIEDNDEIVNANSTNNAATSYEMMGLKGIVDDATYVTTLHGISRSSFAWWKCAVHANDDNSGTLRDLTLDLMQDALSAVEKLGGKVDLILCPHDIRDAYAAVVIADKRHVNSMELDGGWMALEFNGIPLVADRDCLPNTMYFLDTSHLQIMQMSDWSWMDRDGAVLSRVSGADAYEAVIYWYADLVSDRPRGMSFLRDIQ